MMSSPREARSVVVMPAFWRRAWKAAIASGPEVRSGESGMAWKRIRFTRHSSPRSRRASASAWRRLSLTPANIVYSKLTRRCPEKSYCRIRSTTWRMSQVFWTGIREARSSGKGSCRLTARWQRLSSRNSFSLGSTPIVERVTRLGLQPSPQSAVMISRAADTCGQLSSGSPMPMKTALVRSSASSMLSSWETISPAESWPWKPPRPVMQKLQFILQPICEETQAVARARPPSEPSSYWGIITVSMYFSGREVGKRYLRVPSFDVYTAAGSRRPTSYSSARAARAALDRLVIWSMSFTRLP